MNWQWTPYVIPLIIATGTLVAGAFYVVLKRDRVSSSLSVAVLMLATASWAFGYALELSAVAFESKMLWARLQYPGIAVGTAALFIYVMQYTGREQWLSRRTMGLLSVVPLLILLAVFSGDSHGLIWSEVRLDTSHTLTVLEQTFGIGLWIFIGYIYLQLLVVTMWLLEMFFRSHKLYRLQTGLLLLAILVPWLGNGFDLFHVTYFELAPLAFSVTGVAIGWSLIGMRLGEIIPVAREVIINGMDDGVIVLDVRHRIVDLNPTAENLLNQAEPLGQSIEQLWPDWPAMLAKTEMQSGPSLEMLLDQADGRHIYDVRISSLLDWRKRLVSRVVVLRDITERKKAEMALRESEDQLRATFEQAAMGIAHVDFRGRWLRVNQRLCDIVGYSREELNRLTFQDITHPADLDANLVLFEQLLAGDTVNYSIEKRYIHRQGASVWVQVTVSLVRDEVDQPKYFIAVIEDIAERKRTEQIVQKYAADLERSNRELEQFAYIASHDLQEPLRKVQTFGGRIETKYGQILGEQGLDYLNRMNKAIGRMQALIEGLLAFSRITTQAQPFAPVNLSEVVGEVLEDLEARLEQSGGQVVVGPLPTVKADRVQMRQLFQNLIGNALKFHRPAVPPEITVESWEPGQVPPIGERSEAVPAGYWQITVADNGIGFDEQYAEQIFQVFQRLHNRTEYEGTGIGLATCRKIVESHGGTVRARSTPGVGTTFILTFPQHQTNGDHHNDG